jgi:hypothetical protein
VEFLFARTNASEYNDCVNENRPAETSSRPRAIHYAVEVSVCVNVVLALGWYMALADKASWKARAQSLSAELSALKNAAAEGEQLTKDKKPAQSAD